MHDTGLHLGLGEHRRDRLGKALQAIHHRNQHVLDATGSELIHHPQPELRPLALLDP
jgi:hypothetical protein